MFDERQLATLILLALLTITSALAPPVRAAGRRVIRACTRPSILVAVTLYLIWVALLHALALKLGFWNIRLLGESIFWYGASGLAIFWRIPEAGSKSRIFRLQALSVVKASAFVAFFVNIKPFSLLGELLLQASVGVLTALRLTVGEKEEFAPARRVFDVILTIIAVGVLIHVSHFVINQWQQVDKYQEALKLFMPIWLTLGSLPFLFALAVFAQYEVLTKSWRTRPKRLRPGRRARLGVILALRGRPRDIHDFSNAAYHSDSTTTLREGITAVRTFKNRRAERAAAEQTRTERPRDTPTSTAPTRRVGVGTSENSRRARTLSSASPSTRWVVRQSRWPVPTRSPRFSW